MLVAQGSQPREVARLRRKDPAGADHRFGEDGRDPAGVLLHHRADRGQVVASGTCTTSPIPPLKLAELSGSPVSVIAPKVTPW